MGFNAEQLSPRIWKVVEADRHGQYPFLYVVLGKDKCILIDTGCGTGADYRAWCRYSPGFSANVNRSNLPYLVVCTHVHFDHTGGNFRFSGANVNGCLGICMGAADKKFSSNCEINSLCMAHNCKIKEFEVTRWLAEGDRIYLDDANPSKDEALEVLYTPGHTSDSISLYLPAEKRLFVGDTIYPFTAIHLDCIGSNVGQYVATLQKLQKFVLDRRTALPQAPAANNAAAPPSLLPQPAADPREADVDNFCAIVGLDPATAARQFNVHGLLELCDWQLESAVNMYLSGPEDVRAMCPPVAAPSAQARPSPSPAASSPSSDIQVSCGHVEANLSASSFAEMLQVMGAIRAKAIAPQHVDSGYGEYSCGNFTVILSMTAKWE